ncbi:morphogenetic protein associated with SpoVID [Anoxybacillus tepidamans]|uniref:Morphogenetic protein associated with SpoVID n=1 Tax=Anoxybacteroides tepidamans TaxID=265948 RepID=A0A7W8INW7_9BACL|nr:SafA/ExsA family spore coat assembly protein [Anoxybacillus tepidamans]MBB5323950.1 morphogenetic protein associated with SpoVID [Anoxybacillus tepidamans]
MKIHIVQKGDTLWKIAQKYGIDFEQLKKMNGHLSDPDLIMPGMKIKIPTAGVPVKKEIQKKETIIHMHPKKEEPIYEHPYAEAKPFVSFNIETEIAPNVNVNPPAKEAPKAPVTEPAKEAPKAPVTEPAKEAPKAPVAEAPKKPPKAPVVEAPKEVPKTPTYETKQEKPVENTEHAAPLTHIIPPVSPQPNPNFVKPITGMPPLPPKPVNILPNMMKPDVDDTESPEKAAHDDLPPELPTVPYVPMLPQSQQSGYALPTQPNIAALPQEQPCVPVTPVMPGYGFYYPPVPMLPVGYPTSPPMSFHVESSSHLFPGIHESSSESHEWMPPLPPTSQPTGEQAMTAALPTAGGYAPPLMPSYGWQLPAYPQPYAPTAPAYYSPTYPTTQQTGASVYPFPQIPVQPAHYPTVQPSAFSPNQQPFFMMPEYGESSDGDE